LRPVAALVFGFFEGLLGEFARFDRFGCGFGVRAEGRDLLNARQRIFDRVEEASERSAVRGIGERAPRLIERRRFARRGRLVRVEIE
jgi:hypothetical protein